MKKCLSRVGALLLILAMLLCYMPTMAFAAENTVGTVLQALNDAVTDTAPFEIDQADTTGKTIKLQDGAGTEGVVTLNKGIAIEAPTDGVTLDLNGKTLTIAKVEYDSDTDWCMIDLQAGELTLKNGTILVSKSVVGQTQGIMPIALSLGNATLTLGKGLIVQCGTTVTPIDPIGAIGVACPTDANKDTKLVVEDGAEIHVVSRPDDMISTAIYYYAEDSEQPCSSKVDIVVNGDIDVTATTAITGQSDNRFPDGKMSITVGRTANLTSGKGGIYVPDNTTLTVEGKITGKTGIVMNGGHLIVKEGAEITGNGVSLEDSDYAFEGDSWFTDGSAILIGSRDGYNKKGEEGTTGQITVDIEDGTLKSENGSTVTQFGDITETGKLPEITVSGGDLNAAEGEETLHVVESDTLDKGSQATPSVSGGTFKSGDKGDLSVAEYLDQTGNSGPSIDPQTGAFKSSEPYVAQVGEYKYASLQDAVNAITEPSGEITILVADPGTATVNKQCTITVKKDATKADTELKDLDLTKLLTATYPVEGGFISLDPETGVATYMFTPVQTGGYIVPTQPSTKQAPTITGDSTQVDWSLGADGSTLTITPKAGYEITDVTVNGESKGAVTFLSGLKTGDQVVITSRKILTEEEKAEIERLTKGVEDTKITLRSKAAKKGIRLDWTKAKGFKVDYYEVFKSLKKSSGFGKAAYYKTTTGSKTYYINTKELERGTRYYYKVRGVRSFADGSTAYTQWSTKAWRKSPVTR